MLCRCCSTSESPNAIQIFLARTCARLSSPVGGRRSAGAIGCHGTHVEMAPSPALQSHLAEFIRFADRSWRARDMPPTDAETSGCGSLALIMLAARQLDSLLEADIWKWRDSRAAKISLRRRPGSLRSIKRMPRNRLSGAISGAAASTEFSRASERGTEREQPRREREQSIC